MAKSSFSLFFTQLRQKLTKNDQKLTSKCSVKMWWNLTTKTGDSGSAGMLGEKCVIIGALNLDTIIDQKSSQTQKMTKIDQKSIKLKNRKKWKSEKVTKIKNRQNQKSSKSEKSKSKKWKKCHFQKTPKMVKMSDKWHFSAFSVFRAIWWGHFRVLGFVGGPPSPIRNRVFGS